MKVGNKVLITKYNSNGDYISDEEKLIICETKTQWCCIGCRIKKSNHTIYGSKGNIKATEI